MKLHLLVAIDGGPASSGALRLALGTNRKLGATVDVLSVLEPPPPPRLTGFQRLPFRYPTPEVRKIHSLHDEVAQQLDGLGYGASAWPLIVDYGSPGPVIAKVARDRNASLILLGFSSHTTLEHFRSEAALDVLHVARLPVLAVRETVSDLPRSVLVAVDFSEVSLQALRTVVPFVQAGGIVHLAYIAPSLVEMSGGETTGSVAYDAGPKLRALASRVASQSGLSVESHVMIGDPLRSLLGFAERFRIDLVASGSHGYGHIREVFMHSLSTALLRDAPCSVLVVPPSKTLAETWEPHPMQVHRETLESDGEPAAFPIAGISRVSEWAMPGSSRQAW